MHTGKHHSLDSPPTSLLPFPPSRVSAAVNTYPILDFGDSHQYPSPTFQGDEAAKPQGTAPSTPCTLPSQSQQSSEGSGSEVSATSATCVVPSYPAPSTPVQWGAPAAMTAPSPLSAEAEATGERHYGARGCTVPVSKGMPGRFKRFVAKEMLRIVCGRG